MTPAASTTIRNPAPQRLSVRLHPLVKKIHAYIGLLNLSIVLVWGAIGVYEMLAARETGRPAPIAEWTQPYTAPANATDRIVANEVYALIKPPLAGPPGDFALKHDAAGNLTLDFYSPNGVTKVTVLEGEHQLRVQKSVNNIWRFVNNLHATTTQDTRGGRFMTLRLWTYYTELSIWSLLAMTISGLLMWMLSRPGYRPAQFTFAAGVALFAVLYMAVR